MKTAINNFLQQVKSDLPNVITIQMPRRISWQKKEFLNSGYKSNAIVYKCVKEISDAAATVAITAMQGDKESTNVDLINLLKRPNRTQNWAAFMREAITFHQVYGDSFIIKFPNQGRPVEIYNISPELVAINTAKNMDVISYDVGSGADKKTFPVDPKTGACAILHVKIVNPDFRNPFGQSPLEAAQIAVDNHNEGLTWNHSLLLNSGCPSGLLKADKSLDSNAASRLSEWFSKVFTGSRNSGKVPILMGGLDFVPISSTPKDMDFITTIKHAEKLIASAYGVPLPLIDNDAASYNNMSQAKEKFWVDLILPLLDTFLTELDRWLLPAFGQNITLKYDPDSIPALEGIRQRRYAKVQQAFAGGIISLNEARAELGFETYDDPIADEPQALLGLTDTSFPPVTEESKAEQRKRMLAEGYSDKEIYEAIGA